MATSSKRDVTLGVALETSGDAELQKLTAELRKLANAGALTAPEFKAAADQLDRLGQQGASLKSFQTLAADLERLTIEQTRATEGAALLKAELATQVGSLETLRGKQAEAAASVIRTREEMFAAKEALKNLNAETAAASKSDQLYLTDRARLTREIGIAAGAYRGARDALKEVNAETGAAAQALQQLDAKSTSAAAAATQVTRAFEAQQAAMRQVEAEAAALGVETTDVAASFLKLSTAQEAVVATIGKLQNYLTSLAELEQANAAAANERAQAQKNAAEAYAMEEAALADSVRQLEADTVAKQRDAEATRIHLATVESDTQQLYEAALATRGLAQARADGAAEAASELAMIKESEEFTLRYTRAKREAAAASVAADEAASRAAVDHAEKIQKEVEAIDRLAAEAQKLNAAAEYTRFWSTELDRLDAEAKKATGDMDRLAAAADKNRKAFADTFGATGVRSLQAIQSEVVKVEQSVNALSAMYRSGAISAQDLARATSSAQVKLQQLRQEAENIPAVAGVFEKLNSQINSLVSRFGALTAAIATIGFAVKPVIDANVELEALRRTLTFVTGSSEAAAGQIKVLQNAANQAGLSAGQLANSFQLFEASMIKSGQSVEVTQNLFEGVTAAAGKLGLSTDRVSGVLLALGQVASKGKLSLEELQGQVGEHLPGALKIAADSLGITSAQLTKLMADGKIMATDFLPAFGTALKTTFEGGTKPVEGLAQAFNRLKNAATQTSQQLLDTAAYKGLTASIESVAKNFDSLVTLTVSAAKGFATFKAIDIAREFLGIKAAAQAAAGAKLLDVEASAVQVVATEKAAVATKAGTVAVNDNTRALEVNTAARGVNAAAAAGSVGALAMVENGFARVTTSVQGAASKVGAFVGALGGPYGLALTAAVTFQDQLGNAIARTAAKWTGVTGELERNEKALAKQAQAEKDAAKKHEEANAQISKSFIAVQAGYDKMLTATENDIKVTDKLVKAKKEEGDALTKAAELSGDEARAKLVAADAAQANVGAIGKLVEAKKSEVVLLEQERVALAAAAGAQEKWTQDRRDFFAKFDQDLEKKRADLELTKQQAQAEEVTAIKAKLAADSVADHSKAVESLRQAWEDSKVTVEVYNKLLAEGLVTIEQRNKAVTEAAAAEGLYRKSIEDSTKAIGFSIAAGKERAALGQQTIDIKRKEIETDLRIAESTGQYSDKLNAQLKLKELDIQSSRQKSSELENESRLMLQQAAIMQSNLKLGDANYAQKKREIDAIIAAAKAKANESLIEKQALRELEIELGRLNGTLYQTAVGFGQLTNAVTAAGEAYDVFTAKGQKLRNKEDFSLFTKGGANVDAQGFSKATDGNRLVAGAQLQPPDNSGNWTFISDQNTASATAKADNQQYVVQGVGYWKNTDPNFGGFGPKGNGASDSAYSSLGLTSPSTLAASAKTAEDAFLQILRSNAPMATKQDAFIAYAKAAAAANGGEISSKVSQYGQQVGMDAESVARTVKFNTSGGNKVLIDQTGTPTTPGTTGGSTTTPGGGLTPSVQPQSTSAHTLTINFGGQTKTINTASEADSVAVSGFLQKVFDDMGRSL